MRLNFNAVELGDRDRIFRFASEYGEGSCQHSFVSMFSLSEKYGDEVCIIDDTLYTLRRNLCSDLYRVYLAPLGGGDTRAAFRNILKDAHSHGRKVMFITLTEQYAQALEQAFPGRFLIREDRDLAEYMYSTKIMSSFAGPRLQKRRNEVNHFWRLYGERARVTVIVPSDLPDIWEFEDRWVDANMETHDAEALKRESRMIAKQLKYFETLRLSGVVVRIDGEVKGFGYGTKLSDRFYDAIAEKGDRTVPSIYKVLRMESVRQCAMDCLYVNMEEDVGIPGLRAVKNAYMPEYLIRKYIVTER